MLLLLLIMISFSVATSGNSNYNNTTNQQCTPHSLLLLLKCGASHAFRRIEKHTHPTVMETNEIQDWRRVSAEKVPFQLTGADSAESAISHQSNLRRFKCDVTHQTKRCQQNLNLFQRTT
jgi:hypothetical protein